MGTLQFIYEGIRESEIKIYVIDDILNVFEEVPGMDSNEGVFEIIIND